MSGSYRDLKAWQKSIDLTARVYEITRCFPKEEVYGLTSQLRRAAVSVASNIAEGKGRSSDRDFCAFLYRARGSLCELETQLTIAKKLAYMPERAAKELIEDTGEVARIVNGLINSLSTQRNAGLAED